MFEVNIQNLEIKAKIGVSFQERKKIQPLILSLKFYYNLPKNSDANNIDNLKNYSDIIKFLKKFISHSNYKTLEKLILECEKELKKKYKIKKIFLSINKKNVAKKYGCDSLSVSE